MGVKLLSLILYSIRITVLFCVVGYRYKNSNHQCLIAYACRTLLVGPCSRSCYSDLFVVTAELCAIYHQNVEGAIMSFY